MLDHIIQNKVNKRDNAIGNKYALLCRKAIKSIYLMSRFL